MASTSFYSCGKDCKCVEEANQLIKHTVNGEINHSLNLEDVLANIKISSKKLLKKSSVDDDEALDSNSSNSTFVNKESKLLFDVSLLLDDGVPARNALNLKNFYQASAEHLKLSEIPALSPPNIQFSKKCISQPIKRSINEIPPYLQPHPGFPVASCPVKSVNRLTKDGAMKHTWQITLDVQNYPLSEDEEWKVGGTFGICPPNADFWVESLLHLLNISDEMADEEIILNTFSGRWPTIWGESQARAIITSRRELLTWATDFISVPISRDIVRLLAEYCNDETQRAILLFICSKEGKEVLESIVKQEAVTMIQLLSAFPASKPPLEHLLTLLPQLMPRFYSLASDPTKNNGELEFAFSVVHVEDWERGKRHGVATTYLETLCHKLMAKNISSPSVYIFRGLQQNPFAKSFCNDGPMILIGSGVGVAPFRGFIQRRMQYAKCKGKVWIIQGCRNKRHDAIYSEEWAQASSQESLVMESSEDFRYLAESQAGKREYVQEEIVRQSKLIWTVMQDPNGRIYVCGKKGSFINGVTEALALAISEQGGLSLEEARLKCKEWNQPEISKYITEVW